MWATIRTLRLFVKSLSRIAASLEEIRDLYKLELASRGITPLVPTVHDEVEVVYGYREPVEE